jgi:archaeosine-15-forming tRNA-guanine transglycosylase
VLRASPGIHPGEYVLVVDPQDRLLAVGRALLSSTEMGRFDQGVAVHPVAHRKPKSQGSPGSGRPPPVGSP